MESKKTKTEGKTLNLEYIKKNFDYNEEEIENLLKIAFKTLTQDNDLLQKAYKEKDWLEVKNAVHRINSGAGYIGALHLKDLCFKLEDCIKSKCTDVREGLCISILKESKAVLQAIEEKTAL
jgi:HPt (histidine-containing phosphotransfer) domain-containing protein